MQKIRLIFLWVDAAPQRWLAGFIQIEARVVARRERRCTQRAGFLHKYFKFQRAVAFDARVGRIAAIVVRDESLNYRAGKDFALVECVMANAERPSDGTGIARIFGGATRSGPADLRGIDVIQARGQAKDFVACFNQKCRDCA